MFKPFSRASPKMNDLTRVLGASGLNRSGGYVSEDLRRELQGGEGALIYREMRDDDPVIGAILLAIVTQIRRVKWSAVRATDNSSAAEDARAFLESCMTDMSHSWADLISEIMTMSTFGWAYLERVYKRRLGSGPDPSRRSKFTDGRIGWRKMPLRGQESLLKWEFQEDGGIAGMWQFTLETGTVFIPIEKALLFRTESNKNSPEGRSLLRSAYRAWYFKKSLEQIEVEGIERDLKGVPYLTVPPADMVPLDYLNADGTEDPEKKAQEIARSTRFRQMTEQALQLANSQCKYVIGIAEEYSDLDAEVESGAPYPLVKTGYSFGLLSSSGTRSHDTSEVVRRHRQDIALTTLCQFLLLGMDGKGAHALSSDHSALFLASLLYLLEQIQTVLNEYAVADLMRLNGFDPAVWPHLEFGEVRPISLAELSAYISTLVGVEVILPDEALEDRVRELGKLPARDPNTTRKGGKNAESQTTGKATESG